MDVSCALFTCSGFEVETILQKDICLKNQTGSWWKWIIFVPNVPLFQIPIELHNIVLWYLVVLYSSSPKIWGPRDTKLSEQKKGAFLRNSFEIKNYLVRLILCFCGLILEKEQKLKYIMTAKEVS